MNFSEMTRVNRGRQHEENGWPMEMANGSGVHRYGPLSLTLSPPRGEREEARRGYVQQVHPDDTGQLGLEAAHEPLSSGSWLGRSKADRCHHGLTLHRGRRQARGRKWVLKSQVLALGRAQKMPPLPDPLLH
jgi:hypothetical protein